MKWKAIGLLTRKTYVEGRNKAELLRKLQQKYPYKRGEYRNRKLTNDPVYPEPLLLTKIKHLRLIKSEVTY